MLKIGVSDNFQNKQLQSVQTNYFLFAISLQISINESNNKRLSGIYVVVTHRSQPLDLSIF